MLKMSMDYEAQLKLQAYLDGELPEKEAREVANWLAKDKEAVALHAELRNTRQALAGFEVGRELPESREFFWSKIEREIQRVEQHAPARRQPSMFANWRGLLRAATGVAVVALVAVVANRELGFVGGRGPELEAALTDSDTFTYRDYKAGATLVWMSYPADEEVADPEAIGTLQ